MQATPVPQTPAPAPAKGRDAQGRFAPGNKLAVGNPFARQVAALRSAFLKEVKAEDIAAIATALLAKAKEGDVAAAKLVLAYTVGKPQETVDPDHLDLDEWQKFRESGDMLRELPEMVLKPHPALPLTILNAARPVMTENMRQYLHERLQEPKPGRRRRGGKAKRRPHAERVESTTAKAKKRPHAERVDYTSAQPSPSPDGSNGRGAKPAAAPGGLRSRERKTPAPATGAVRPSTTGSYGRNDPC